MQPDPQADLKGAGIYIHIPFCLSKCDYCSFFSIPVSGLDPASYLDSVTTQAERMARHPWVQKRLFTSLFIGGGTPTVCDPLQLAELVRTCRELLPFAVDPEISMETNPNSLHGDTLRILRDSGVNRISIGIQSFSNQLLKTMARSHTVEQAHKAICLARGAGFTSLNLDLIYGLPEQHLQDWRNTLEIAQQYSPEHFSIYELMVEAGTVFAKRAEAGELPLPTEDEVLEMEQASRELLGQKKYQRYEISNYALPGHKCRHNLNYWHNGSYLGLGAGAVSCFSGLRLVTVKDPLVFADRIKNHQPVYTDGEALSEAARFRETVIMGLRMLEGIRLTELKSRFNTGPRQYYGAIFDQLIAQGLIEITNGYLRLTPAGLPVANQVLSQLV